jgi:5-methylcytosine-specific restriction endonuclease McrA
VPVTDDSRCAADGVLNGRGLELDHIVPFRDAKGTMDERKRFDVKNLQLLCERCHSRKTATKDSGFARR